MPYADPEKQREYQRLWQRAKRQRLREALRQTPVEPEDEPAPTHCLRCGEALGEAGSELCTVCEEYRYRTNRRERQRRLQARKRRLPEAELDWLYMCRKALLRLLQGR